MRKSKKPQGKELIPNRYGYLKYLTRSAAVR